MKDIVSSKKMENGIVVFWEEPEGNEYDSFNYSELIDMRINALDLLDNPRAYAIDVEGHRILIKK